MSMHVPEDDQLAYSEEDEDGTTLVVMSDDEIVGFFDSDGDYVPGPEEV